jgi:hypothetical protein
MMSSDAAKDDPAAFSIYEAAFDEFERLGKVAAIRCNKCNCNYRNFSDPGSWRRVPNELPLRKIY